MATTVLSKISTRFPLTSYIRPSAKGPIYVEDFNAGDAGLQSAAFFGRIVAAVPLELLDAVDGGFGYAAIQVAPHSSKLAAHMHCALG